MSFTYNSRVIANPLCQGISITTGAGHYVLKFNLRFDTPAYADSSVFWLNNLHSKVYVSRPGHEQISLGRAEPETPLFIKADQNPRQPGCFFELRLSPHELNAIEAIRSGGDLSFQLRLIGQAGGKGGDPLPAGDQIQVSVGQSEWIKQLNDTNFSNILLIEVPLPSDGPKKVLEELVRARDLFLAGHNNEVVARCRAVLETVDTFTDAQKLQPSAREQFQKTPRSMSAEARLRLLHDAVAHYTHPAHHADDRAVDAKYSRSDAALILALTTALASHATR